MVKSSVVPFSVFGLADSELDYSGTFPESRPEELKPLADRIRSDHTQGRETKLLHGGAKGIFIHSTDEVLGLYLPTVEWMSQTPVPSLEVWKVVRWNEVDIMGLENLLSAGLKARREQFRKCRFCGDWNPPEHRIKSDVCHSCAERDLGVIF